MQIKGFTIANEEKYNRVVFGVVSREGKLEGGIGEEASDEDKLAGYDKLGGLILKGKNKVKTGSFYDFSKKKPRTKAEVVLVFRDLEGQEVELGEDEEIPVEVKAAEAIASKAKAKGKKKKSIEDEE